MKTFERLGHTLEGSPNELQKNQTFMEVFKEKCSTFEFTSGELHNDKEYL